MAVDETDKFCPFDCALFLQILRRPRIGRNRLLDMETQPQNLTRRCEVTAILVLYGLPRSGNFISGGHNLVYLPDSNTVVLFTFCGQCIICVTTIAGY
jgi:hypothetical protein